MVAAALTGFLSDDGVVPQGTIVTAVFPGGCQLKCGFCIVRLRKERNTDASNAPTPDFYNSTLRSYAESGKLAGAAVIGDEPLQEAVWPYVSEFLGICTDAHRPSTLVTNGLELTEFSERLEPFSRTQIVVSLDSIGWSHDRTRGLPGAFDRIIHGLRSLSPKSSLFRRLSIATILRPGRLTDAKQVLEIVASLGIKTWLVSPLLDPRLGQPIRVHTKLRPDVAHMLRALGSLAVSRGVQMVLSDEFGLLDETAVVAREVGFVVKRPRSKPSLVRLDAHGRCCTWDEVCSGLSEAQTTTAVRSIADRVMPLHMAH